MEYGALMDKLGKLLCDSERLRLFNGKFHEVILQNDKNTDYCLMENGVVKLEELKKLTDKVGIGTLDFYKKETDQDTGRTTGRCVKIPSKDTLLLIGVCLELEARELNELLSAAGYGTYIKNLKEFIIYCGINNIVSIDEIRRKLLKYGYREQAALMNVEYGGEKDAMRDFGRYFDALCDKKDLDKRKVLEQAGLLSPNAGAEKNKYYLNAFYGSKAVKIRLSGAQVKKLCAALGLTRDEAAEYIDFLSDTGIISKEDRLRLGKSLRDDGFGISEAQSAEYPRADGLSVLTQQITTRMERLRWEELDAYIAKTFDSIRSFAIFYEQLLVCEGYKNVLEFCRRFSLSEKSHYNYVAGITIPELVPLTVFSFLMKTMTLHVYNTLLKKAGKLTFNIEEDSAVYVLATELLTGRRDGACPFGKLFNCAEELLDRFAFDTYGKTDELQSLYGEMCRLITRNLLAFEAGKKIAATGDDALKRFSERGQAETPFYAMLNSRLSLWPQNDRQEFSELLAEKFGFAPESRLPSFIITGVSGEQSL